MLWTKGEAESYAHFAVAEKMLTRKHLFLEVLLASLVLCCAGSGCSIRRYALNTAANALAGSGATFASDDDPELIKTAAPFDQVRDAILQMHSYELPECMSISIEDGSPEYLKWLTDSTK